MSLIIPHRLTSEGIQRHTSMPYLWRATCTCGASFLAPFYEAAKLAIQTHFEEEDPFPFDMTPEDPAHGRND